LSSIVHRFGERLKHSQDLSDEPSWIAFYRRIWPDLVSCVRIDANSRWQKIGIDRLVLLSNGNEITVDEKKRDKDWGDLLIEEWSVYYGPNDPKNKIGWSLDPEKQCDFVAYAVPPSKKCYLLPYELTRQTCLFNLERWKTLKSKNGKPNYPLDAQNETYRTRNCAVDWEEFTRCFKIQMLRKFGSDLVLPVAESYPDQMQFTWKPTEAK
jgi:hypothetical protein